MAAMPWLVMFHWQWFVAACLWQLAAASDNSSIENTTSLCQEWCGRFYRKNEAVWGESQICCGSNCCSPDKPESLHVYIIIGPIVVGLCLLCCLLRCCCRYRCSSRRCKGDLCDFCSYHFYFWIPVRSNTTRLLYHQTSAEVASAILESGNMHCGNRGLAGGGIYFAETPEHTDHKAKKKGAVLECAVRLGRVKRLSAGGDKSITYESLKEEGYDSVCIARRNGLEYVVYDSAQVTPMRQLSDSLEV
mmetsp:Transcript_10546/g.19151  ORF Transcript_10546/g.19151 Transcript_10546/m.19151 type:complete len:247 (-) Transcript_10546:18-758(-)